MKVTIRQVLAVFVISIVMLSVGFYFGAHYDYSQNCLGTNWHLLTSMRWDSATNKTLTGHDSTGIYYEVRIGSAQQGILTPALDSAEVCVLVQNLYSALRRNAPTFTTILVGGDTLPIDAIALANDLGPPPYLLVIYMR